MRWWTSRDGVKPDRKTCVDQCGWESKFRRQTVWLQWLFEGAKRQGKSMGPIVGSASSTSTEKARPFKNWKQWVIWGQFWLGVGKVSHLMAAGVEQHSSNDQLALVFKEELSCHWCLWRIPPPCRWFKKRLLIGKKWTLPQPCSQKNYCIC